jgi:hypothetical protein
VLVDKDQEASVPNGSTVYLGAMDPA